MLTLRFFDGMRAATPMTKGSPTLSVNFLFAATNSERAGLPTTFAATTPALRPLVTRSSGPLELNYHSMELEDLPGHTLTVYPAAPDSASDHGLKLLATWAATEDVIERARAVAKSE